MWLILYIVWGLASSEVIWGVGIISSQVFGTSDIRYYTTLIKLHRLMRKAISQFQFFFLETSAESKNAFGNTMRLVDFIHICMISNIVNRSPDLQHFTNILPK